MKVSKVGAAGYHQRTAVRVVKAHVGIGKKQEGFMYKVPKKNDNQDMTRVLSQRKDAFKSLYKVFNEQTAVTSKATKADREVIEEASNLAKSFDKVLKKFSYGDERKRLSIPNARDFKKAALGRDGMPVRMSSEAIDYAINRLLRKSLKRPSAVEDLKEFLVGMHDANNEAGEFFFRELKRDYEGDKLSLKAITNLNLVIQPSDATGEVQLSVSGTEEELTEEEFSRALKNHEKGVYQRAEKQALRSFISQYATLDEAKRCDLRNKLRRIVVLYFYGMDEVRKTQTSDFDAWKDHAERRSNTERFVDDAGLAEENYVTAVRTMLHEVNSGSDGLYQKSLKELCDNEDGLFFDEAVINVFWLRRITKEVERVTEHLSFSKKYKIEKGYLSEKTWKGMINYLSVKYIALGKAVYHFAMEELGSDADQLGLGKVKPFFVNGISSFEMERIKAEESLQRETAVYVAFAARHLASATINVDSLKDQKSDILTYKREDFAKNILLHPNDVSGDVLQFWGGKSIWKEFDFDSFSLKNGNVEPAGVDLLYSVKQCVYAMRNESFHFVTKDKDYDWNENLIGHIFEQDCQRALILEKEKFYSNNLPMFYKESDLLNTLNKLYSKYAERASQVPAFNTVFVRNSFSTYLASHGINPVFASADDRMKFVSAVYYLYKELYYNCFLQDKRAKDYFIDSKNNMMNKALAAKDKHLRPTQDFVAMLRPLEKLTLPEICQAVMTEFNQQNNQGRKKKTARMADQNKDKFRHYVLLLHECIRSAFNAWMNDNSSWLGYLKNPMIDGKLMAKEVFLPNYKSERFSSLIEKVKKSKDLQKWYVTSRILAPKQANQFAGSIRSYRQYVEDVAKRAAQEGDPLFDKYGKPIYLVNRDDDFKRLSSLDYYNVLEVIDLCTKLNGAISHELTDYFESGDEYARYLNKYLDFECSDEQLIAGNANACLAAFCEKHDIGEENPNRAIYHDGTHPIMNRNIVMAKLYGESAAVVNSIHKVNGKTLDDYWEGEKKIQNYKKSGCCKTAFEQENLKRFQEIKNRIEFRDIVEYGEILNELQGQLVNWAYLRERDLMYFQLGFHYACLHNESSKPNGYVSMKTADGKTIDGAILYQIAALYIHGFPVYGLNMNEVFDCVDKNGGDNGGKETGVKITEYFQRYCRDDDTKEFMGLSIYEAGLELFENRDEHRNITRFRDYIVHFRYFSKYDHSMIELYSEVFDRFFGYDMKYQKNALNMFNNILLSHMIIAYESFDCGMKAVDRETSPSKKMALIQLKEIESETFTYKLNAGENNEGKVKIHAKNKEFLDTVARMLSGKKVNGEWRDEIDTERIVKVKPINNDAKDHTAKNQSPKNNGKNGGNANRGNTNQENTLMNKAFAGITLAPDGTVVLNYQRNHGKQNKRK